MFSPFISSLVNFVCHTCFKRQEKLHHCGQCKFAHYCDRTCQKDAWLNHKNECLAIKRYGKVPNENIRLELGPGVMFGIPKCQVCVCVGGWLQWQHCQAQGSWRECKSGQSLKETEYGHFHELPLSLGAHFRGRMGCLPKAVVQNVDTADSFCMSL